MRTCYILCIEQSQYNRVDMIVDSEDFIVFDCLLILLCSLDVISREVRDELFLYEVYNRRGPPGYT